MMMVLCIVLNPAAPSPENSNRMKDRGYHGDRANSIRAASCIACRSRKPGVIAQVGHEADGKGRAQRTEGLGGNEHAGQFRADLECSVATTGNSDSTLKARALKIIVPINTARTTGVLKAYPNPVLAVPTG